MEREAAHEIIVACLARPKNRLLRTCFFCCFYCYATCQEKSGNCRKINLMAAAVNVLYSHGYCTYSSVVIIITNPSTLFNCSYLWYIHSAWCHGCKIIDEFRACCCWICCCLPSTTSSSRTFSTMYSNEMSGFIVGLSSRANFSRFLVLLASPFLSCPIQGCFAPPLKLCTCVIFAI